jgi:hypothetical protein
MDLVAQSAHHPRQLNANEPLPGLRGETIGDFWAWAYSDGFENTQRAIYAEYLVATALGITNDDRARTGWRSYDLLYEGKRIEVKASAYIQSWKASKFSTISFGIGKRLLMDDETAQYLEQPPTRIADAYVFALFTSRDYETANVWDVDQWRFYVVPTDVLEKELGTQKTAGLATIARIASHDELPYPELRGRIRQVLQLT